MKPHLRRLTVPVATGLSAAALSGCGGGGLQPLVLRPQPIPYADTLPIHEPEEVNPNEIMPLIRESTVGELGQPFDPDDWIRRNEALNITHFDEVVNSAWFKHRISRRELSAEEVRLGPTSLDGSPVPPFTVTDRKSAGIQPGMWVEDGKGDVYLFKFDPPDNLYMASAANTISNRLFWAAGFHVPEDYLVTFDAASLVLRPEGEGLTAEEVAAVLQSTSPLADGRYRAIASKLLPGPPKGPFRFRGTRKDDPNDYYLHQNRRELRGLYVISAWTNHVDMRFANTLDVWIDPPGYLRHYLQDFAATLGSGTIRPHSPREGIEYNFGVWDFFARLPTFGFYTAGWEGVEYDVIDPSIGWLPVDAYEPGSWKPNWPNAAFRSATAADGYWAAKIVASFGDSLIRAAVEAGELPSRRATDTLTAILIARRDRTVGYWFDRVSPLEGFRRECTDADGEGFVVTFGDLGILAGVRSTFETLYEWELDDEGRGRQWKGRERASGDGRQAIHVASSSAGEPCLPLGRPAGQWLTGLPGVSDFGDPVSTAAAPDTAAAGRRPAVSHLELTRGRLAVLRIRAERLQPTARPRPPPVTLYLLWTDEGEYVVAGLHH